MSVADKAQLVLVLWKEFVGKELFLRGLMVCFSLCMVCCSLVCNPGGFGQIRGQEVKHFLDLEEACTRLKLNKEPYFEIRES